MALQVAETVEVCDLIQFLYVNWRPILIMPFLGTEARNYGPRSYSAWDGGESASSSSSDSSSSDSSLSDPSSSDLSSSDSSLSDSSSSDEDDF